MLENYRGQIELNGTVVDKLDLSKVQGSLDILLTPKGFIEKNNERKSVDSDDDREYRITVKAYMTRHATPDFDFMAKMNNDNPMPMRIMVGRKIKETKGMEYWELHGEGRPTITCMRCGKELTNPISRKYGIGPECLTKLGFTLDIEDVEGITEKLEEKRWSGWVVKTAITNIEEV